MNNKNQYIKLEITNNDDYVIYLINDDKTTKLSKKNTLIMSKVLKKYIYKKTNNNIYIFPNIAPIMISFEKEKNKLKRKKVNREKSRKIILSTLLTFTLTLGGGTLANNLFNQNNIKDNSTKTESNNNDYNEDDYKEEKIEESKITNLLHTPETNETIITLENKENNEIKTDYSNITYFNYEWEDIGDKEALKNAEKYMDIFKKYERIYGIDAKILCSIAAQESSGIHKSYSENGYATGLMGIENVWDGETITAYNFEKNEYESITIDYSRIGELDYNCQIGAIIYQYNAYNVIKNNNNYINPSEIIPLSYTSYNGGIGNKNKIITESQETGNHWLNCRNAMRGGDKFYFEHCMSRYDNDTTLTIKLPDRTIISTCFYNTKLNNTHTK